MFTLVMMTALSGTPDAVQFGGRGGCSGGGMGVLGGLFHRGGRGAVHSADCCGPVASHSCCDPCGHSHHVVAAPACGGCGMINPAAPAPLPVVTAPAAGAPQQMPQGEKPAADKPAAVPPVTGGKPAGTTGF